MKLKSIIVCGMLLIGLGATTTSCEDMFTAENNIVSTNLAPQDTLFQMMGIIKKMQVLADRTVLLGEVRADLVEVDKTHAPIAIQELASNNISESNVYNKPSDYYAVINNCNIYLAYVDSLLKTHGEYYYEQEICGVKCFRAWCYLELVKIYGEVPLVTEPVLTTEAAEEILASGNKSDMKDVLDFCIKDLAKYPYMAKNQELIPVYGNSYNNINYSRFFIPVRALLGELYLWRGSYTGNQQDYIDAIRMYHDFFCFTGEERAVTSLKSYWYNNRRNLASNVLSESYTSKFDYSGEWCGVIPLDTIPYYGNTSDLRAVFNSTYANDYYPAALPSSRMKTISKSQDFCKYIYQGVSMKDTIYGVHQENEYEDPLYEGDLRLYSVFNTYDNSKNSKYDASKNKDAYYIAKYLYGSYRITDDERTCYIPYFRVTVLYLHLAEALNRAGFPETAFAILAHGLNYKTFMDRDIISEDEFNRLCEIKSYGFSSSEPRYSESVQSLSNSSFVIWSSSVFGYEDKNDINYWLGNLDAEQYFNIGIHSIGSGDTEFNQYYQLDDSVTKSKIIALLPVPAADSIITHDDSVKYDQIVAENKAITAKNKAYLASDEVRSVRQKHVSELILDEEALEGSFEGYRFYDLLRYQMQAGKVSGSNATIVLPEYITVKYGALENDNMTSKPWYLKLPR